MAVMSPARPRAGVVVSSFDRSSDCWPGFFHGLRKYWPDCPLPVYLISNELEARAPGVIPLKVGTDRGWSSNLLAALERLEEPYLLYFQEDYWLLEPVDTDRLLSYLVLMEERGLDYLRLLGFPPPDRPYSHDARLGIIDAGASYRTSLQAALWRKKTLQILLQPGESAWDFETSGTDRSRVHGATFLSVWPRGTDEYFHGVRYLCSAINRGRWARLAVQYATTEGVPVDFSQRPIEGWWHEFQRRRRLGALASRTSYRLGLAIRDPRQAVQKLGSRIGRALRPSR